MNRPDPHSYFDAAQARTTLLEWRVRVDFPGRALDCFATLHFDRPVARCLDLDTRRLEILAVTDGAGAPVPFRLHEEDPVLGSRLELRPEKATAVIRIRYRTDPAASALQWLDAAQTAGGKKPFVFSQCQAIHARSIIPLQDCPAVRLKYRAQITHPGDTCALMAAATSGRETLGDETTSRFEMPQPIPPYLIAFAVGDLAGREVGPRSAVWAEPGMLDAGANELAEMDAMLTRAEVLFGPYAWDRFDVLIMPPSFPYGGMENPRLTFLTPTVIAGDRSLVNVVAHELAHSWTGNLVTNANAEHFWLNEGFTVFAERRILQALYGADVADLHAAIGRKSLDEAMERFKSRPQLTRLRTNLKGVDPDDAYSQVPYEKGYLFLRTIEEHVGRERFDAFLMKYIERFRFTAITTSDFEQLTDEVLPGALRSVGANLWLNGAGVPANAPVVHSARLAGVEQLGAGVPTDAQAAKWSPLEWHLYLERLPRPAPEVTLRALDQRFQLGAHTNFEIKVSWLLVALASGHTDALPAVEQVLAQVGRMKYLRPLYLELAKRDDTRAQAAAWFDRYQERYHPIARQVVASVLRSPPEQA